MDKKGLNEVIIVITNQSKDHYINSIKKKNNKLLTNKTYKLVKSSGIHNNS